MATTPVGSKPGKQKDDASALWRVSGLGIELAGAIVGMVLIGWALDTWLKTSPRWMLICGGVGILGGGYNFIRSAMKLNRQAISRYRSTARPKPVAIEEDTAPDREQIERRLREFERELKKMGAEPEPRKQEGDDE
ncbi:MAG TPA: AtpZ/AtpI family protein [Phycisphaerales bacterium]|nr:AtpZ/AtpI family protein [Phycisphaerales bacterium]